MWWKRSAARSATMRCPAELQAKVRHVSRRLARRNKAKLAPAVRAERRGQPPIPGLKLPGKTVALAGSGSPAVGEAAIDEFGPKLIKVPVGGSVDLIMDFTAPGIRGMSVFHCHLLNHEDKGMMAKILFE